MTYRKPVVNQLILHLYLFVSCTLTSSMSSLQPVRSLTFQPDRSPLIYARVAA